MRRERKENEKEEKEVKKKKLNEEALEKELKEFLKCFKGFFPLEEERRDEKVEEKELRVLTCVPPIYVCVGAKVDSLCKVYVLTEELWFGFLSRQTPIVRLPERKLLLVALPFWIYATEDFLKNYSLKLGQVRDGLLKRIEDYSVKTSIPSSRVVQGKYVRAIMQRLETINALALLSFSDEECDEEKDLDKDRFLKAPSP